MIANGRQKVFTSVSATVLHMGVWKSTSPTVIQGNKNVVLG